MYCKYIEHAATCLIEKITDDPSISLFPRVASPQVPVPRLPGVTFGPKYTVTACYDGYTTLKLVKYEIF